MSGIGTTNEATTARNRGFAKYVAMSFAMLLLAFPVAASIGDWGPVIAWALTLVPGAIIVFQASRFQDSHQSLPFMLASMMFRIAAALGGGMLVLWLVPALPQDAFLAWLGGMYLVALAAEIYLTMSINSLWTIARPATHGSPPSIHWQEAGR